MSWNTSDWHPIIALTEINKLNRKDAGTCISIVNKVKMLPEPIYDNPCYLNPFRNS